MEHIQSSLPKDYVADSALPDSFDWRNVNGKVFVTKIGNQLQPKFCGSCWAFAATSVISDRMKIMQNATKVDINLAVQVLLDCGQEHGAGGCDGGSSISAFQFMHDYGITDDSCAPYMAVDYAMMSELPCEDTMCRNCDRFGTCFAVPNATKHFVAEWGQLKPFALTDMMKEIYARGPILCGIYAHSDSFENYSGGIITDATVYPEITHAISVVGWGSENGIPYWIVRNSFGTIWGEEGWFRIQRGSNCLLIESECSWATPKMA